MTKKGQKKRYLRKCINFGAPGSIVRELVEAYETGGADKLSAMVREAVYCYLSQNSDMVKIYRTKAMIEEFTELCRQQREVIKKKNELVKKLTQFGVNREYLTKCEGEVFEVL